MGAARSVAVRIERPPYSRGIPHARSAFNPKPHEFLPPRRGVVQPGRVPRPQQRRAATNWMFGLALIGSTVAGAVITLALWGVDGSRMLKSDQALRQMALDSRSDTYRIAPAPAERALGWDAEVINSDRSHPLNFPRVVKTLRITPEVQRQAAGQTIKMASAVPGVQGSRSPLAVPMGKATEVKNWRYQLQGVNPAAIARSSSDLVVIDYAGNNGAFSREQIEQMRRKPDGSRRIVLSYMSIGEAESYRWYWPQRSSTWLGPENPKWKGNYGVRFWLEDWQKIIFEYTDQIIAAGFDGVYLDKVDEYEEIGHKDDMVDFVARIGQRAKAQRPDFLIVSQNGDQLITNPKFRGAIDAFAREDLFYGESSDGVRNSTTSIHESVQRLKLLTAEGKPVFVVEYPRNEAQAHTATREISEHGFVGLMARRALDVLER